MILGSTVQYAFRAVLYIAEHGAHEPVRVDAIAADLRVPRNYLSKTLHALARAGILKSGRGPRGGFQLARPPRAISFADIAAPFDDLGERRCLLGRATCGSKNPCSAHARWETVSSSMRDFFRGTTVADLLGEIAEMPSTAPRHDIPPGEVREATRGPAAGTARAKAATNTAANTAANRTAKRTANRTAKQGTTLHSTTRKRSG